MKALHAKHPVETTLDGHTKCNGCIKSWFILFLEDCKQEIASNQTMGGRNKEADMF